MMFVVTVEFIIAPDFLAEFMLAMKDNARQSLEREPGCAVFDVCQHPDTTNRIFLYECYQNKQDFDDHLNSPHFLEFDQLIKDWVQEKIVQTWQRATL